MRKTVSYTLSILLVLFIAMPLTSWGQDINVTDANGLKQGDWIKKDENGKVKYKGQFVDNLPQGKFKYFDKDGTIITVLDYVSADSAVATHFHSSSKKAAHGYYVNQLKEGIWRFYDREGILASKETYSKGVKEGDYFVYNLDGSISRETHYTEGVENGYLKTYSGEGELLSEGNIVDGQMDGEHIIYRSGKINVKGSYKHAVKVGEWVFYDEEGNEYRKEYYELGIKTN